MGGENEEEKEKATATTQCGVRDKSIRKRETA